MGFKTRSNFILPLFQSPLNLPFTANSGVQIAGIMPVAG